MPSMAVQPPAYHDTCERTSQWISRTERPKEIDPAWQGISNSQVHRLNTAIDALQSDLAGLSLVADNWNGYGSPRPSAAAISTASSIVSRFRLLSVVPEKVTASADGGVALIFVGVDNRRAVIESFGTEEDYVLLYDTQGKSCTIPLPSGNIEQDNALIELQSYLRGIGRALQG